MAKLLLERVSFEIGSIKADGYTANQLDASGNYINYMSASGMALMIDLDDNAALQKRLSKELKSMLGKDFKPLQGECKNTTISCWTTLQAATFFQYHAYKGNKKAQALGIALRTENKHSVLLTFAFILMGNA